MSIGTMLLIIALILLLLAAINVPSPPWVSYGWLGLFFVLLAYLLGTHVFR